jgi:hypothetical protein
MGCIKCDITCNDVIILAKPVTCEETAPGSIVHHFKKFVTKRLNQMENNSFLIHSVLSTYTYFVADIHS